MTIYKARLDLSRELVDDIELSRNGPEALLLKAARLARLMEDESALGWISWEINGYPNTAASRARMLQFGRLTAATATVGYWQPLAGITGAITGFEIELESLRIPDVHFAPRSANPQENVAGFAGANVQAATKPIADILQRRQALATALSQLSGVRSRVLGAMHDFVVGHYHELAFGALAESIFEEYRVEVDRLLVEVAPEAVEKIPAVYARLAEKDPEAISQAMNSIRRIIKATADKLYPPSDAAVQINGQSYDIGSDKVLNRLDLYVRANTKSESRQVRLRRTLRSIHERASASAHDTITTVEARSLFFCRLI
jgi:hypothetical protein